MYKLNDTIIEATTYIYTYSYHDEERALCHLEMRSMFGVKNRTNIVEHSIKIDPSRSPFIKERIEVIFKVDTLEELLEKVHLLPPFKSSFKVIVIRHDKDKIDFEERRSIEREVGLRIPGTADLHNPDIMLAIMRVNEQWIFGYYEENKSIWYLHQKKPHQYSTALSTRVARAVVNIAVPELEDVKVIDPCCGIGTVLVEALSMGIDIVGGDSNPLVMKGARENIAHFGYNGQVILRDIREVTESYDVAIIDMPYNLCSVITDEEQLELLQSARRFARRVVIVTIEQIDSIVQDAGFTIVDRCEVSKGTFTRQILVCE
ncbi:RNA methyltransferase [Bacillus sp. HMF5848]|uniref:TRM11 family SAM-dependent methyltransferase n=1 Tax=Bacillus sp. HMF5848 TaxID=2495421 RepID=UPI000F791B94|nr:RsmD family RNA methyltransferase [Bacillus sp. HMF5848]RSK25902.1 RNA methyltransferase [Bacillus sp. HMF5848]